MAFALRNFQVLAYTNGFTLWHYKSGTDTLETMCSDNYFGAVGYMLSVGDMVMMVAPDGARIVLVTSAGSESAAVAPLK